MGRSRSVPKPLVVFGVAVAIIAVGAVGVFAASQRNKVKMEEAVNVDTIYEGISIENIDVSGKTKTQALIALREQLDEKAHNEKVTVVHQEQRWDIPFASFDAKYDYEKAVNTAWETGRTGDLKERYKTVVDLKGHNLNIEMEYSYDRQKVEQELEMVAQELNQEAQDSTLTRKNGAFVITDEKNGYEMDISQTADKAEALIVSKTGGEVEPVIKETEPKIKRAANEQVTDLIGTFYTTYSLNAASRNENLRVGSNNVNGTVIAPGEVFSMNDALGPQTYENGYKDAGVYVNGKVEQGVGGGVCQITTTLYNAAIFAELEIVERSPHSMTVGYVPLGRDSAVAGTYKDLKFRNNTDVPIYLEVYAENGKQVANIYGKEIHEAGRKLEFETVYEGSIPKPAEKITEDDTLEKGVRKVTSAGKEGSKVSVYKKVFQNGKQVSRELFSTSTYRSTADEVVVGTMEKPVEEPVQEPANEAGESVTAGTTEDTPVQETTPEPIEELPLGAE